MKELTDLQEKLIELKHGTYPYYCDDLLILFFKVKGRVDVLERTLDEAYHELKSTRDFIDDLLFIGKDESVTIMNDTTDLMLESVCAGIDAIDKYRIQYDR